MSSEATEEKKEAGTEEGAADVQKKSPMKLILMIAVPILLLGITGGVLYFTSFGRNLIGLEDKEGGKEKEEVKEIEKVAFFELPDLLVNLNAPGKPKFLKLSLTLEVADPHEAAQLKEITPRIVDEMQVYLRELVPDDLKGSEGIYRLRDELLKRVNMETKPIVVKNVLFKDLLIQ